jgi:hypothetical protein
MARIASGTRAASDTAAVLHGDHDDTVSIRIATSYAAAARGAGDPCSWSLGRRI